MNREAIAKAISAAQQELGDAAAAAAEANHDEVSRARLQSAERNFDHWSTVRKGLPISWRLAAGVDLDAERDWWLKDESSLNGRLDLIRDRVALLRAEVLVDLLLPADRVIEIVIPEADRRRLVGFRCEIEGCRRFTWEPCAADIRRSHNVHTQLGHWYRDSKLGATLLELFIRRAQIDGEAGLAHAADERVQRIAASLAEVEKLLRDARDAHELLAGRSKRVAIRRAWRRQAAYWSWLKVAEWLWVFLFVAMALLVSSGLASVHKEATKSVLLSFVGLSGWILWRITYRTH